MIGVVSRGTFCTLNSPAIYGSVKMAFGWIKEIVEKEMDGKGYCPQKQETDEEKNKECQNYGEPGTLPNSEEHTVTSPKSIFQGSMWG